LRALAMSTPYAIVLFSAIGGVALLFVGYIIERDKKR